MDTGDVGAGVWFCDGDADSFFAEEEIGEESLLELLRAEFEDWRDGVGDACC